MRLVGAVIKFLPQNNHLDSKLRPGQRRCEHFVRADRRRSRLPRLPDALLQLREIGLLFSAPMASYPHHKRAVHQ